jgi:enoyl-CoA hydratase
MLVTRTDDEGVATLSLNRPEALNALSPALFVDLRGHIDQLREETEAVGCVVLRGEGRSFSAGNDLKAMDGAQRAPSRHFQAETIDALESLPQPVVASVRGHCYTGALEVVLGCDLLVAAETAKFADTHGKWGMSPTWGMSQRLPRRVGPVVAKELMLTGRVVTGDEAVRIGLANECVPDEALETRTAELAAQIASNSWFTLRMDKHLVGAGLERPLSEGLAYEREHSPGAGPDMRKRLEAFSRKS